MAMIEEKSAARQAAAAIAAPSVGRWQAVKRRVAARREAYMFASPALFLIVLFVIFPLIYSFVLTFHNYDLAIGPPADFVGLDNYREMLEDKRFWQSWLNTFLIIFPAITGGFSKTPNMRGMLGP